MIKQVVLTGVCLLLATGLAAQSSDQPDHPAVSSAITVLESGMTKRARQSRPADDRDRVEAIGHLAYVGRGARPGVPVLVKLLGDENPEIRFAAAAALLNIDSAAFPPAGARIFEAASRHPASIEPASFLFLSELDPLPEPAERFFASLVANEPRSVDAPSPRDATWTAGIAVGALSRVSVGRRRHVVPVLTDAIRTGTLFVRTGAAFSLRRIGADTTDIAALLRGDLESPDPVNRAETALVLLRLGVNDAALASMVRPLCDSDADDACALALRSIGELESVDSATLAMLQEAVSRDESEVATAAAEALARFGDASDATVNVWIRALSALSSVRTIAKDALAKMGMRALPALREAMRDENNDIRSGSVSLVSQLGPPALDAVAELTALLGDADPGVRGLAATALGQMAPDSRAALPRLIDRVESESDSFALGAMVRAIGAFGADAASADAALQAVLRRKPFVAKDVADALRRIGDVSSVDSVIALLKSQTRTDRLAAVEALGARESDAARTVPALRSALHDQEPIVRVTAAAGLATIDPDANDDALDVLAAGLLESDTRTLAGSALTRYKDRAVPVLIAALRNEDTEVRETAAHGLSMLGTHAALALDALVIAGRDPSEHVRASAMSALAASRASFSSVQPTLESGLRDASSDVRTIAIAALGSFGADAAPSRAAVVHAIDDPVDMVRRTALLALPSVDPLLGAEHLNTYVEWLSGGPDGAAAVGVSYASDPREMVAVAVGRLGSAAQAAVPALERLSQQESGTLRNVARVALAQIDPSRAPSLVRDSVALLTANDIRERLDAITVLGILGRDAQDALPALERALGQERELDPHIEAAIAQIRHER